MVTQRELQWKQTDSLGAELRDGHFESNSVILNKTCKAGEKGHAGMC